MGRMIFLALVFASGCFERQYDCDDMAIVSVVVTVASSGSQPFEDLQVWYTRSGDAQPQSCDEQGGSFLCGYELDGALLIEASAGCHGDVSETVVVPQGRCHPEQQDLQLLMDPLDCTQEELPGVYVTVANEDGAAIPDASVGFVPTDQDWTDYEPCEAYNDGWGCAWGLSGDIDIQVTADGYAPWTGEVTVGADCCGPVTEPMDLVLVLGG